MVAGIILILAGMLIAIYPPLLSLIIAFGTIFAGVFLIYLSYYYRKTARKFEDPFINFFLHL